MRKEAKSYVTYSLHLAKTYKLAQGFLLVAFQ